MVKVKATVGMYRATRFCDTHAEDEIITIEEFNELVKDIEKEKKFDKQEFTDYLNDGYTIDEVFEMTEEDKQKVQKDFEKHCLDDALDRIQVEWEYFEVYTEVVISEKDFLNIATEEIKVKGSCPCPCNQ